MRTSALLTGGFLVALVVAGVSGCTLEEALTGEPFSLAPSPLVDAAAAPVVVDAGSTVAVTDAEASIDAGRCASTRGPSMVQVGDDCIDSTEVTNEQYAAFLASTAGTAVSQPAACAWNTQLKPSAAWPAPEARRNHPVRYVDWCDARAYCAWAGKSLCGKIGGGALAVSSMRDSTKSIWYRACTKHGTQKLPYGGSYIQDACNVTRGGDDDDLAVRASPLCEGGIFGVFDLVGNVSEWIDACEVDDAGQDNCVVQGGAHQTGVTTDCNEAYPKPRSSTFSGRGFRCCK